MVLCILCSSLFFINPIEKLTYANDTNKIHQQTELTLDNDKVDYIYQGDANEFEYLKSKNLQGYVFLPDVDTDIGYFVDKQTSNIYFFHPSGYLELVK